MATVAAAVLTDGASLALEGEMLAGDAAIEGGTELAVSEGLGGMTEATGGFMGDMGADIAATSAEQAATEAAADGVIEGSGLVGNGMATAEMAGAGATGGAGLGMSAATGAGLGLTAGQLISTLLTPQQSQSSAANTAAGTSGSGNQSATAAVSPGGPGASGGSSGTMQGIAGTLLTTKDQDMGQNTGGTLLGG